GGQHAARRPFDRRHRGARGDVRPVGEKRSEADRGVHEAEGERRQIEAGHDALLPRRHHGCGVAVGRCDGAGAAQVFDERLADDRLDEQVGQRRQGHFQARLARLWGAIADASAKTSASVIRDRRGPAGRFGKSRRQWAPALYSARSAAMTIASAIAAGSAAGPAVRASVNSDPTAALRLPPSRITAAARDRIGRTAAGSGAGGCATPRAGVAGRAGAPSIERATIAPNTAASLSELLAKRLAPCNPVQAASPHAQSPVTELRPSASTKTPPI